MMFKDFEKFFVGFDDLLHRVPLTHNSNYPPVNIIKQDGIYTIEMAVAGFKKSELEVTIDERMLSVKGNKNTTLEEYQDSDIIYLVNGLSRRSFTRNFSLAEGVEVTNTKLEDGILSIELTPKKPDPKKPKQIEIN